MADLSHLSDEDLLKLQDSLAGAAAEQSTQAATHGGAGPGVAPVTYGSPERQAGLTARAAINGIVGLPGMAMDAGVNARDLSEAFMRGHFPKVAGAVDSVNDKLGIPSGPGPAHTLPFAQDFQQALSADGLPDPETPGEKIASFGLSGLAGGLGPKIPEVTPANPAPAGFVPPDVMRAQLTAKLLKRNQDNGFVVPPSTTNPTVGNKTLESIAGKDNVAIHARAENDAARTAVGARTLGLNDDAPFTLGAVQAVKEEAGQAWEAGRKVPLFKTDNQYLDDLIKVQQEGAGANESFPGAANPDIASVVDTYTQGSMTGNSAVSAVKLLRGKASDAFTQGNGELGRAYKGIAQAIENQMERAVQNPALGVPKSLVSDIKAARAKYAKASLLEDSMLPDGTVSGPKLAAAWRKDEPITGELRDAAEFAAQYPKANIGSSASGSPVSHLAGGIGPLLAGGLAQQIGEHVGSGEHGMLPLIAGGIAYPAARGGARAFLLSQRGQARALPAAAARVAPRQSMKPQLLAGALADWDANRSNGRPAQ